MPALKRRATAAAVAAAAVLLSALLAAPAVAQVALDSEEAAAVRVLNEYRASRGLQPFTVSPILTRVAEWMAEDQAGRDLLDHRDRLGRGLRERNNAFGYPSNTALRENLAAGNATGAATMQQWMDSHGHYLNNIATDVVAVGIARVPAREGSRYGWFWALEFGSHEDAGTASVDGGATRPSASKPSTGEAAPAPNIAPAGNAPVGAGPGTFASAFPQRGVGMNIWNGGSLHQLEAGVAQGGGRSVFISARGRFLGYIIGAPAFVNAAFTSTFAGGDVPAGTVLLVVR